MALSAMNESIPTQISPLLYTQLLWKYIYQNKWTIMAFVFVIMFTLPVEMVVLPRFYSQLFESVRSTKSALLPNIFTNMLDNFRQNTPPGLIYTISIIWLVVVTAYLIKNTMEAYITPSYMSFVRQRMFQGTIEKHADNYKDLRIGEHVTRLMDVSRNMRDILVSSMSDILPIYIAVVCLCVYLLSVNVHIGVTAIIGISLHTFVLLCTSQKNIQFSALREKYYLALSEKLHDSFGNLMNVYINNMKNEEINSNNDSENRHKELMHQQYVNTRNVIVLLSLITVLTFICTVCVTYTHMQSNTIDNTTFISVWIIILLYLSNMMRLSNLIPHLITKFGIVLCSNDFLLDILSIHENQSTGKNITVGAVTFSNVQFTYDGNAHPTLYNVNFTIAGNEKVAILGTSGSGKTTAMKMISRMHQAQQGQVLIDDVDVSTISLNYLRTKVNYINQRTNLFNMSILKNMQYGNNTPDDQVISVLNNYGLNTVFGKLKNGVHTNAGVGGGSLSLGMQKVTMLMRGLLRGGKIIIMDEPLAGLDAITRQNVMHFVKDLTQDKTLIVITHDKEILPMMDRVIQFGDINRTEEYKPPENVIEKMVNYLGF